MWRSEQERRWMESAAVPGAVAEPRSTPVPSSGEKGLKKNAIGFASSVVIGVASTAPGYGLAATLGSVLWCRPAGSASFK
jgi:hypothetical protein